LPGTRIGRGLKKYLVQRKLAEGGMAEVFLCSAVSDSGFSKDVVVKRIRSSLAREVAFMRMFAYEARVSSRLCHPNIVQVLDFDSTPGAPGEPDTHYLVLEWVDGLSLFHLLQRLHRRQKRLSPLIAAHICAQVARGLDAAHHPEPLGGGRGRPPGIVHRDVSPQNVLLSKTGEVKLADFGIAKAAGVLTHSGVIKGKVRYMSPEQARGLPLDGRSDIFSLGVVLWEALTGARLFRAASDVGMLKAVCLAPIPSPIELVPTLPPSLSRVVMKALERDLKKRYQTAREIERALQEFLLMHVRHFAQTDVGALVRAHC
jgi:serine/threonine-protein kinase